MRPPDPGIAILADLALLGITARVDGDKLWVGPRAKLTPELAARIRQYKAEMVEALRWQTEAPRDPEPGSGQSRYERFGIMQTALRRRGFHVLADKPKVVLALLAAAEETAAKLGEGGGDE